MGRQKPTSNLVGRPTLQSDLGYITTEGGSRIATETGSKIELHIGIFSDRKQIWS